LDAKESATRNLKFVAWDIIGPPIILVVPGVGEQVIRTLNKKLGYLLDLGFDVVPFTIMEKTFTEQLIKAFKENAEKNSYPIDGLVVKYNDCIEYEACGRTDHHFKGGMAFKFADEEYETYLKDIEWTMGRTGVLTPVAVFEPVDTGDSIIERASLHNVSIMKELLGYAHKGQPITIFKANDIIPQVSKAENKEYQGIKYYEETDVFSTPTHCPICGGTLEIVCEVDSEMLICTNDACEGKAINRLEHFCSKKGLDIKGLSKATLGKLMDWGWVKEPADLYTLHKRIQVWANKPGFGIKSVNNILNAIDNSRLIKLENFICALGIPHVGTTLSRELVNFFSSYEEFRQAVDNKWDFTKIDKVGYEKAYAIWSFDYGEADKVAQKLHLTYEEPAAADTTLDATTVVITGKLSLHKNRDELVKRITDHGGKVTGSVSKNTNILINNDVNSTSSKNVSAQRLGIPIMTEEEFVNLYLS
jgi:DNA ligase (NAD+)